MLEHLDRRSLRCRRRGITAHAPAVRSTARRAWRGRRL
jgi:hypothetical protein